jgi:hypothetical protein
MDPENIIHSPRLEINKSLEMKAKKQTPSYKLPENKPQTGHQRTKIPGSDNSLVCTHPKPKCRRISCLNEHCARACKLAHKTFSCSHSGHNTARCHPFQNVLGVPGHEMPIVDDIPLIFNQLEAQSALSRNRLGEKGDMHLS